MEFGVKTSKGKVREKNEDYYYISYEEDFPLFIIADGMGGHKAGEIASKRAVETISTSFEKAFKHNKVDDGSILDIIKTSILKANEDIYNKSIEDELFSGMGTTVTLAFENNGKIFFGHVGDSRAYLLRDNNLLQITTDHSLVEELVSNGSITKEEARVHPQKNMITRAVGTDKNLDIDLIVEDNLKDDIILLCTDGLSNMVNDNEIKEVLVANDNLQNACESLVDLSNENGGFDNISVIAIKFK